MRSRVTSLLIGSLILPAALASVCFVCGCSDEAHTTGTLAERPPGAEEARQKSIESMKALMHTKTSSPKKGGR